MIVLYERGMRGYMIECFIVDKSPRLPRPYSTNIGSDPDNEANLMTLCRMTREALEALREAAEVHLTHMFDLSKELTRHAHRVTLLPKDIEALLRYE